MVGAGERLMAFPWIIPTINEPMSAYTAMAFGFIFVAAPIIVGFGYNWLKREFNMINRTMTAHDRFVEQTAKDISEIRTDIAVLLEQCSQSRKESKELKHTMDNVQNTLLQQSKR